MKKNKKSEYKMMKKKLIHPLEKPTRVVNIIIFFVSLIVTIALLFNGNKDYFIKQFNLTETSRLGIFAIIGIVIYVLGITYAKTKSTSVKISEKQFPEIYEIVKAYSAKLELNYLPEAYVVQQGGVLNAFATSFFSKRYISINSDIFEVYYLEHKDINTLSFVIAHELAHLKRKHATTVMSLLEAPSKIIPIWSSAVSRIREYTSDKHAAWLCPEGIDGIMILCVGKHLYKNVDVDEYVYNSSKYYKGFFCFLFNLKSSHPVFPKRMKALKNFDKHGKIF